MSQDVTDKYVKLFTRYSLRVETFNKGLHLKLHTTRGVVDFYPTTLRWAHFNTSGRGVESLIDYLGLGEITTSDKVLPWEEAKIDKVLPWEEAKIDKVLPWEEAKIDAVDEAFRRKVVAITLSRFLTAELFQVGILTSLLKLQHVAPEPEPSKLLLALSGHVWKTMPMSFKQEVLTEVFKCLNLNQAMVPWLVSYFPVTIEQLSATLLHRTTELFEVSK
jgi:hypothetical protein